MIQVKIPNLCKEGSNHMFDDQEIFSFELEETLYFERGQEVSEMVGISLDPTISIHSHNDYVSIKGQIILEGQYEKVEAERIEAESFESDDAEGRRCIDQIEDDEDGLSHFFHQFPIEVSIPAYRVVDVEKISVYVDSFDYELKNNNELRVHSLIHIYGIQSHDEPLAPTEEFDTTEQDLSQELEPLDQPSLSFELKEELLEEYMREEEIEEDTKDIEERS